MIVADTNLLAYFLLQGEFTDLAESFGCRLVTSDRRLLAVAAHVAVSLEDFAMDTT